MRSNPLRWLLLAGAIHITLTFAIFLVGKLQLLPSFIDANGTGLTFAIDATVYRKLASDMVTAWHVAGFSAWLAIKAPLHCRLYSLLFAVVGSVVGHNILAAAPLNLFYYLAILSCVYFLGREVFNPRAGLLAAIITGAWPSFLLHSTQLMRDPLSILCLLTLLLVFTLLLSRELSWRAGIALGIGGAALVTLFWLARGNMWNVVIVATGLTILLLVLRMFREAKFFGPHIVVLAFVLPTMLLVPARLESTNLPGVKPPDTPFAIPTASQAPEERGALSRAISQIGERRDGFRNYRAKESNIDNNVRLTTIGDVLRYIPRATVIGFFAPFPEMWVQPGNFGLAGRLLSGAETTVMYFLYLAAAFCFWQHRRRLKMWLIFLVATLGMIALGLVVMNAGALYRLRYAFWILIIIMAAEALVSRKEAQEAQRRRKQK